MKYLAKEGSRPNCRLDLPEDQDLFATSSNFPLPAFRNPLALPCCDIRRDMAACIVRSGVIPRVDSNPSSAARPTISLLESGLRAHPSTACAAGMKFAPRVYSRCFLVTLDVGNLTTLDTRYHQG